MRVTIGRWKKAQEFEQTFWGTLSPFDHSEWDEVVTKYTKHFNNIENLYQISPLSKILDVGCGPTCPSRLFSTGIKYGVDPLAKKLGYEGSHDGVEVTTGVGEDLPYSDNGFDVVVCINSLDHMQDPHKVLKEIHRVLKKGGVLVLSLYTYTNFIRTLKRITELLRIKRNIGHPHVFTEASLRNLILRNFVISDFQVIHTGHSPTDYGKVVTIPEMNTFITKLILEINSKVFMQNYFVKDLLFTCLKKD